MRRRKTAATAQPDSEPTGWQAQKSASTREQILDAALRCFVELGYANTTTTAIADKAGLSRGAMLHHFPSKVDVVRAAVEHLHAKRLKAFQRSIGKVALGEDRPRKALEVCLEHVRHPLYVAFLELWMAARTDAELLAILQPTEHAFADEWHRMAVDLWPEWRESAGNLDLALDLVWYVMDGLAVRMVTHRPRDQELRVIAYLEEKIRELSRQHANGSQG